MSEWLPVRWPDDDEAAVALEDWLDAGLGDFTGLDFRGAELTGAPLSGAVLSGADLRGVGLRKAELDGAQLTSADLRGADLGEAQLPDANLDDANLTGANLAAANLTRVSAIGAVFQDTNLRGADLTAAMLDDVDLSTADLTEAVLDGAFLPPRAKRIELYGDAPTRDEQGRLVHGGEPFTGELVRENGDRLLSLETYRDGVRQSARTWYDSGILRSDGRKRWHPNGMPAEDGEARWDERGEPTTRVDRDHTTEADGLRCHDGKPFTGQLEEGDRITSYRDGLKDGPWWAPDAEGRHEQGVRVGEWRRWHSNGRIRELTAHDPQGAVTKIQRWDANGFLLDEREAPPDEPPLPRIDLQVSTVEWDDGARLKHDGHVFTGEAVTHGYSGEVTSLVTYRYGVEDGPQRTWYEDGTPKSELTVRRGVIIGVARDWHPDGRLARERVFDERGDLASERHFT
ncbi:pentapeptide repeat-containing protein [Kutzneria sp. NPDC051319]|uniref:pentapeptide repeat-containing protein n=1 Tax=Kutzneria sp. NPDC051319 TaxID=3155047 RepID=UPI00343A232D